MILQMKLITPSLVSERLKINLSLARNSIKYLKGTGAIKEVSYNSNQSIATRAGRD